ncbi:heparinase II/III family protein [Paenibacillus sp. MWE-103]|uniref:Heparinase II/III family protein n=1 Tax=Paenibacillus artemisiicola TaxID=1172618 RepID=A0ABS3W3X4_9BACL|nr:heparinase II/III family protein [Paenibacillus artemisiicola]MBO7743003.1 heparinase II/III family protein [Paenibacillus artemisiicola]
MLTERYGRLNLGALDTDPKRIAPFPDAADRAAWSGVSASRRELWLNEAERWLDYAWPALKASARIEARLTGKLSAASDPVFDRRAVLGKLVIGECLEDEGRFLGQIVNGILCICEETTWGTDEFPVEAGHEVHLISGETAALLLWTRYLLQPRLDAINPAIGRRIKKEVRARVLNPYLDRDDYWWMGFRPDTRVNNWNPWCNLSCLTGFLLAEDDPEVRDRGIRKVMTSLDRFILTHPADGCCDEGPMYWEHSGGALYDCLELLRSASGGAIDIYDEPIVRDIGSYLYKVHIDGPYYANFADGDAQVAHYPDVIYGYGVRIGDERLQALGAATPAVIRDYPYWFPLPRFVRNLFQARPDASGAKAPYVRDAWLDRTQVMTARSSEGTKDGLFVAAKGGNNLESHNHNDVGSFIVYADGRPVLIDLGTEWYTAKTFSPQRYEIWTTQSAYHNLPTVRGAQQRVGGEYRASDVAYACGDDVSELSMNIAGAYPPEAGIASWRRTVSLRRSGRAAVEVTDDFALVEPTSELAYTLMTPCVPREIEAGLLRLDYAPDRFVTIAYDAERLTFASETIPVADSRLRRNWGDAVYRILFAEKAAVKEGRRILRIVAG